MSILPPLSVQEVCCGGYKTGFLATRLINRQMLKYLENALLVVQMRSLSCPLNSGKSIN